MLALLVFFQQLDNASFALRFGQVGRESTIKLCT